MLTNSEKRRIERALVGEINRHPRGIDTRTLITAALASAGVPAANRHHVSGMLAWVWRRYRCRFLIRTPGYSVIAA